MSVWRKVVLQVPIGQYLFEFNWEMNQNGLPNFCPQSQSAVLHEGFPWLVPTTLDALSRESKSTQLWVGNAPNAEDPFEGEARNGVYFSFTIHFFHFRLWAFQFAYLTYFGF